MMISRKSIWRREQKVQRPFSRNEEHGRFRRKEQREMKSGRGAFLKSQEKAPAFYSKCPRKPMEMLSMGVMRSEKCFKRGREASAEIQVGYDGGLFQLEYLFP